MLALSSFALTPGVGGAGEHAVFGGDLAFAAAAFVDWNFFFNGGGAQNLGVPHFNQDGAFSVASVAAGDAHGAQGVEGAVLTDGRGVHGREVCEGGWSCARGGFFSRFACFASGR